MGKASSAKRVAKLAQKGKGRKIRFQGGTLFPAAILIIGVLGALLIFYARSTRPDHNSPPTVNDHWHVALGFYACDTWLPDLSGALETATEPGYQKYVSSGVHSHDDGVIHWHPFTSKATGTNAKFGLFLDNYGVTLTKDKLEFPAEQGGATYEVGETKCTVDGQEKDAVIKVVVYDPYDGSGDSDTYITDFDEIAIENSTSIAVVFAPEGTNPGIPPHAKDLPALGAIDTGGQIPPEATTPGSVVTVAPTPEQSTAPGDSTAPESTVAGATTVPGETATTVAETATTVAGDTATTVAGDTATSAPPTSAG